MTAKVRVRQRLCGSEKSVRLLQDAVGRSSVAGTSAFFGWQATDLLLSKRFNLRLFTN